MTTTVRRDGLRGPVPPGFAVLVLEGQRGDGEAALIRDSVDPRVLATVPGLDDYLRSLGEA